MVLASLVEQLNLTVRCCGERLDQNISGGYVGDLLSDVIAHSDRGNVWITRQSHHNIVAVAELKEHAGIIVVLGRNPEDETVKRAEEAGIPILTTELTGFEVAGKLYEFLHR